MYIAREENIIVGVYTQWHEHAQEILPKDNAEVMAFLARPSMETDEDKIEKRVRKIAIDSLKADGGLPPDYEDIRRQTSEL